MTHLKNMCIVVHGALARPWPLRWQMTMALVLGLVAVGTFAPFSWGYGAVPLLTALFILWHGTSMRAAFCIGFAFGVGLFGGGISWTYFSIHDYGHVPVVLAVLSVAVVVVLMSLYPALAGLLQAALAGQAKARDGVRQYVHLAICMPATWVGVEWLREWLLTGFPWLVFGYTQSDTVFAGYAPLLGVHGVGLALALSAAGLAALSVRLRELISIASASHGVASIKFIRTSCRACFMFLATPVLLAVGGGYAKTLSWSHAVGAPVAVAMLQGNVPLELKWQDGAESAVREHYVHLSRIALAERGDAPSAGQGIGTKSARRPALVVWPEAAVPGFKHQVPDSLWGELRATGTDHVLGIIERDDRGHLYNSAVVVRASDAGLNDGQTSEALATVYRKEHLVPFGEYLPWRPLFAWILNYLHIPMSDFTAWRKPQAPLLVAGLRAGISICYEDIFPAQIRQAMPSAHFFINLSEDAWFGNSLAPHQRLQMARLRAMENQRYMVRATNTGPSAVIDEKGQVHTQSAQFRAAVLRGVVQPLQGATPYSRYGNTPLVVLCILLMCTSCAWRYHGRSDGVKRTLARRGDAV